ncbi:ATP-binding protein [Aestuariibaculum sediminum]|uniref:ATP-binding protein n=1 Tax=Aestuariibaculum sediminum TaxID=2770637 RepID=A0A8J6QB17_9FLAO|nr:ATP-binding protein [Aestuariibaculum sediminum]MBD0832521.1 ATP-binding protein [Aestuariibaculum sediminum]
MRYLNKIVFINSASVRYAEIELDGNVHLIGTQGVGKSTLLRAILFFYNANKTKLGIPREKKGFDDYYFGYQNSYVIYEVLRDGIPFCVLAYRVNGKVAFRFFDSGYKRELFIDQNNRAYESWENIRNAFGKSIYYTPLVTSYEDFRKIIYGDNKAFRSEYKKYAITESKQFQNIPRTIQNVFLNSNLEAKFIKDTIINSLNEDEFVIDIENYAKNHLRDFESQINDIKIWFKENKNGQILIRAQAEKVINNYRIFNFLKREKEDLAHELAFRIKLIEDQNPVLSSSYTREKEVLEKLLEQKEKLTARHQKKEKDLEFKLHSISEKLTEAKNKQGRYDNLKINEIIEKVAQKETLLNEQKSLNDEKNLLTAQFSEISKKYEVLISNVQIKQQEFVNNQKAEINSLNATFTENKVTITNVYQELINQINSDHKAEKDIADNELRTISEKENRVKNKKAELKYQVFFKEEIEECNTQTTTLNNSISEAKSSISNFKNIISTTRKEWDLEQKGVERSFETAIEKETVKRKSSVEEIQKIETKIKQSESSLYGWLNSNYPDWEKTIGKVIDQEHVLFNSELTPRLVHGETTTLFGVELNLNALNTSIKTVKDYFEDIKFYNGQIKIADENIQQLNSTKKDDLQKLKNKFNKQIKQLKEAISENEYNLGQSEEKLKKNKVALNEWLAKSKQEKDRALSELENELEVLASDKQRAKENLVRIEKGIKRKITIKENERDNEITAVEKAKDEKIKSINTSVTESKTISEKRIEELKKQQNGELDTKGADTKRLDEIDIGLNEVKDHLDFIEKNQTIEIEYKKDKREIFDKVPLLKAEKVSLEKSQVIIKEEHKTELEKEAAKCINQEESVGFIKSKLEDFERDLKEFEQFKGSEVFSSIQSIFLQANKEKENPKTAIGIISELKGKYYKGIECFKELQFATNAFTGNFNEYNIFSFKVKLSGDDEYLNFASELKEFIEEDKIHEYEKRVNERFANIIQLIGRETAELNSKEAEIEKIIDKINKDFLTRNFVQAIKEMEMRTQKSSNPIVKLLIRIKEFNDENSLVLGETNLFTSADSNSKNQKAVELLKQLVEELERTKTPILTLSESFDLEFRIVENDNDSGWVEKLSNVGSEGTDILVKAMINILLLNVFKDNASRKFKEFKLHCMMDEIGKLHPNNVRGILRFANERNILLINGSPTSQNATDYKYTYKLAKEQSIADKKKYITKVNRLVKVNSKVLN